MLGGPEDHSYLDGSGARPLEPRDPRRIGPFRLLGVLGSGGMGRVYLGVAPPEAALAPPETADGTRPDEDTGPDAGTAPDTTPAEGTGPAGGTVRPAGHYAAVKQVLPALAEDTAFLGHFGHELDNLGRLPGRTSARLLASDREAKPPWFATDFIPGITLSEALRLHDGPLPADALWRLLRDAADGLRTVHAAGIVHRDLKPSNVMLTLDGLTLIDFGVARAADQSRLTKTGMVVGTPAYMAPEQAIANQKLTTAADVFALASLVLYAANGRPPFGDGSGLDLLYRIVHEEPDLGRLPRTDPELAELVGSCLAKDPAERPGTDALFARADARVPEAVSSPWPPAVTDRITAREAFAGRTPPPEPEPEGEEEEEQGAERVPPAAGPPEGGKAGPDVAAKPENEAAPAPEPARPSRRRRVLLVAVPVVIVAGTTLTLKLAPFEVPDAEARPGASGSRTPGTPTASASGGPTATASGSPSPTASASRKAPDASASARDGGKGGGTAGGADGTTGSGSTGTTGGGTGSSTGSGGSNSSGSSGGSSGTTGSGSGGGGVGQDPALPATTAAHAVKNLAKGTCLASAVNTYGGTAAATTEKCGGSRNGSRMDYTWTYKAGPGNTFTLVNGGTGKCLEPKTYMGYALNPCDGSARQSWKITVSTSRGHNLVNTAAGTCLSVVGYAAAPSAAACDAQATSQLWTDSV